MAPTEQLLKMAREFKKQIPRDSNPLCLEMLISTVKDNDDFLARMFAQLPGYSGSVLIIHQSSPGHHSFHSMENIRCIFSDEKGISKSRNMALQKASGDVCLFADDDLEYYPQFADAVIRAHQIFPEFDIILFRVDNESSGPSRKYSEGITEKNVDNSAAVISYEITFKRKPVLDSGILFDENFGLGGYFHMSEERIFIADCIRRGLRVLEIPVALLKHAGHSTGMKPANRYINQVCHGAAFNRIYGNEQTLRAMRSSFARMDPASSTERLQDYFYFLQGIVEYRKLIERQSVNSSHRK